MSPIDKTVGAVDRFQQRVPWLAFPVAVWKKFSDDQAGHLAALITYYSVAAIFPLLLILGTVLNITLSSHPEMREKLLNSALSQYPVIGTEIKDNLGTIGGSGVALAFGVLILVYGTRGAAAAMQRSMCELWDIPRDEQPGFPASLGYNVLLTLTVGGGFVLTTFISGVAGGAGHLLIGLGAHVGAIIVSFVLNVGMFWLSFRLATVRKIPYRELRVGAVIAAVVWQVLQLAGGYVIAHQLHRASALYGTFGVVLFWPDDLNLAKAGPEHRRRLLNQMLVQIEPGYARALSRYTRVVEQRNHLLRRVQAQEAAASELEVWDLELCRFATQLVEARAGAAVELAAGAAVAHVSIAPGETLELRYLGPPDDLAEAIAQARSDDVRRGVTTVGPHRDDLAITLAGRDTRAYASQGQQRTAVVAIKLAEAQVVGRRAGEPPVLLLDDVLSELDADRRQQLLKHLGEGAQVVVTSVEADPFPQDVIGRSRVLRIAQGRVLEEG